MDDNIKKYEELYEVPTKFYLGKHYDLSSREVIDEMLCYRSKDLVTHALCVGMTGSGKTGLCLSLLEEAAIDGIPVICVDPKGDLGNLLLTFPELKGSDFTPWVDRNEAAQKGLSTDQLGQEYADMWRKGIGKWHQSPERIQKFRDSTDVTIYTPGSNVGVPLTVLKSFDAPAPEVLSDAETMREKVASAASGLLTLLGIDIDPLTSREHILLSNILDQAWRAGKSLSLADIIRQIQVPPIDRVGVIDLESFFPAAQRAAFAMKLNNLLASPSFAGWLDGEALSIKNLLYTKDGKPRLSIISIAHLSDSERMFFVTILLGELLAWMRAQPGTGSLRALFYMDEVYGYFPPSAKPPSKPPMLTLLKQARAFGLGIALATQNPVDLDYKGLSNIGTWFLGRLQTDRDKQRVLDGLEGAAAQAGGGFDRGKMEQVLAALGARVFLMNNVHDDKPTIFQTRWALSFLRGPLSREQVSNLMKEKREALKSAVAPRSTAGEASQENTSRDVAVPVKASAKEGDRPIVSGDVIELFWDPNKYGQGSQLVYMPAILGQAAVHFVHAKSRTDKWLDLSVILPLREKIPGDFWDDGFVVRDSTLRLKKTPEDDFVYEVSPPEVCVGKNYKAWGRDLQDYLYRTYQTKMYYSTVMDKYSALGVDELDARIEFSQSSREIMDAQVAELESSYGKKIASLETKLAQANARLEKERAEAKGTLMESMVTLGTSVLGSLLGSRRSRGYGSSTVASAARKMSQASNQKADVARAEADVDAVLAELAKLKEDCESDVERLRQSFRPERLQLEEVEIPCRKGDMQIEQVALLWVPFERDEDGELTPLVDLNEQEAEHFARRRRKRN